MIYYIFDFLTTIDIIRAFVQLNHRYATLVRSHIKKVDLTNGCPGKRRQLQWILEKIETVKVDQGHTYLLTDIVSSDQDTAATRKSFNFFLSPVLKRLFTCVQKKTNSFEDTPFPDPSITFNPVLQIQSLHLVNVFNWNELISNMNLKKLVLWFDNDNSSICDGGPIPQTLIRFASNVIFATNYFHENLIDLNIRIRSVIHLLEIIEHTPNIQYLSVTLVCNSEWCYCQANDEPDRFETMMNENRISNNLTHLSFATKHPRDLYSQYLLFSQIQAFIDRCCPNKTILKKVSLKFAHIMYDENLWLTILRYKNTFDRFNFYTSLRMDEDAAAFLQNLSSNDNFAFHIERNNDSCPYGRFIHIYSLPYMFNDLHGFTSCSELSPQCSFSTVRHLYLPPSSTDDFDIVSFKSLTKYIPHLTSIDCHFINEQTCQDFISRVIVGEDIFHYVRFFRFTFDCGLADRCSRDLLPQLLIRMPHLETLITSTDVFIHVQHPLMSIKRLHIRISNFRLFDALIKCPPNLTNIFLINLNPCINTSWLIVSLLFTKLQYLTLISCKIYPK